MRRSSQDGGSREAAKRLVRRALAPLLGVSALYIFEMVFSSLGGVREKQPPSAQQTARVSLARQAHRTCGSKEASGGYDWLFGWNPLQCSQKITIRVDNIHCHNKTFLYLRIYGVTLAAGKHLIAPLICTFWVISRREPQ